MNNNVAVNVALTLMLVFIAGFFTGVVVGSSHERLQYEVRK